RFHKIIANEVPDSSGFCWSAAKTHKQSGVGAQRKPISKAGLERSGNSKTKSEGGRSRSNLNFPAAQIFRSFR
ncbi:MAG TPA: hypothetical protein DDX75_08985, partial [Phycisphaerales bacterium]|nr:hypothetical protein [Phycisphaerales bacterium]